MAQCQFKFGEKKYVIISVRSIAKGCIVDIAKASWLLTQGGEEEASGQCLIDQQTDDEVWLKAYINPLKNNCYYDLTFDYSVGEERFLYPVKVRVVP